MTATEIQKHLKRLGFYHDKIDGIIGKNTKAAIIAFKKSVGLRPRDYVGPITMMALRKSIKPAPANMIDGDQVLAMPTWLRLAYSYLGLREIPGRQHNADILKWWERLALPFKDDETPWCAGFVNAMIQQAGLPIVKKNRAAALSWRWNGYGTRLGGPALGAVCSITRPGRPGSGHQFMVAGRMAENKIAGLGGNQGDMVSINPYHPTARDAQYHWPEGTPLPKDIGFETLPLITSSGAKLTNEA